MDHSDADKLIVSCMPLKCSEIRVKSRSIGCLAENTDYSMNRTGMNIVVIDKETGHVLDAFNVNTYSDPGYRVPHEMNSDTLSVKINSFSTSYEMAS